LLNLMFAHFGASAFSDTAHALLDHSLNADKLLHGFNLAVFIELLARPEFGPMASASAPAMIFAFLFLLASLLFMPGVLLGYASDHRISRDEFYRACGRNIWRFVRLFSFFAVIAGIVTGVLSWGLNALVMAADKTSNERLPFFTMLSGMVVILVVLTIIRVWFDLAQTDVVLRDQSATRKSIAAGFRKLRRNFGRLVGSYVVIATVALVVLVAGILLWHAIVPSSSVVGAFLVGQATLLALLATRFWQRATAVAFYVRETSAPADEELHPAPVFAASVLS
jgi:hypothetical protein